MGLLCWRACPSRMCPKSTELDQGHPQYNSFFYPNIPISRNSINEGKRKHSAQKSHSNKRCARDSTVLRQRMHTEGVEEELLPLNFCQIWEHLEKTRLNDANPLWNSSSSEVNEPVEVEVHWTVSSTEESGIMGPQRDTWKGDRNLFLHRLSILNHQFSLCLPVL